MGQIERKTLEAGAILGFLGDAFREGRAVFMAALWTDLDVALVFGDDHFKRRKIEHLPTVELIRRVLAQIMTASLTGIHRMACRVIRNGHRFKSGSGVVFLPAWLFPGHRTQAFRVRRLIQAVLGRRNAGIVAVFGQAILQRKNDIDKRLWLGAREFLEFFTRPQGSPPGVESKRP